MGALRADEFAGLRRLVAAADRARAGDWVAVTMGLRVRRGLWDSRPSVLSCSCRNWGHRGYREADFGFRCAMDPP